jgi:cell division transport system ATP-binding protein
MIRFENVTKIYPGQERAALDSVNLEITKGEFVFLVGLSGSGKSTFLRLILREERPTNGVIHVAGKDLGTLAAHKVPELRRQVGTWHLLCMFLGIPKKRSIAKFLKY